MQNPHLAYRPDIDGLRAIAILAVVAFHAFPVRVPGGFVGVDVFFVISGYLIGGILIKGFKSGHFSFREFYARRIKRIFPALILVLFSCLAFGWYALLANEYKQLGMHTAASAGFVANFVFWREAGYFDTASELKPLLHLWSLGVEEQFYIVWPVVLFLAWKRGFNLFGLTLLVALLSFILNVQQIDKRAVATFYLPVTRIWELLSGSLLAWISIYRREGFERSLCRVLFSRDAPFPEPARRLTLANIKSNVGLFFIVVAVLTLNRERSFPGWYALLPTIGALLMISAGPLAWVNRRFLANKLMVFIGVISYPLYLWHWPVLSFARIMESGIPSREVRIGAVALSFVLSFLTWRLLERQLRFRRHWSVPVLLAVCLALVGGLGYSFYVRDGLAFRVKASNADVTAFTWSDALYRDEQCAARFGELKPPFCRISERFPVRTALVGDSHANHLFPGLDQHLSRSAEGLLQVGGGGCVPFFNVESTQKGTPDPCLKTINGALNYVLDDKRISTVILASRGPLYLSGHGPEGEPEHDRRLKFTENPSLTDYPEVFAAAMRTTLKRLLGANKEVVFVIDVPELAFDPKSCVEIRPLRFGARQAKSPCAVPRAAYDERNAGYRAVLAAVLKDFPAVKVWDPARLLCDEQFCWAMKDGTMLYRDDDHLSLAGSLWLGERFDPK